MTTRHARFDYPGPKIAGHTALFLSLVLLVAMIALPAHATTINFDDIDASAGDASLATQIGADL